ncbi:MAG TPA: 30S ribosomal protein S20, partial [Pyrinomonadaceae bacterium]|nr:30S ribosomal protein S20 [Pyrinomonadaceae bacterium]
MPNHKSAEKRVRQSEKRRTINRGHRSKVRTYIKKIRTALESGKSEDVQSVLPEVMSVIDKSVQ